MNIAIATKLAEKDSTTKPWRWKRCPACDRINGNKADAKGVVTCARCGAIFHVTGMYLGESYEYVLPGMTTEDVPPDRIRYFDFTVIGSKGVGRRHGWYDIRTKLIVQVG